MGSNRRDFLTQSAGALAAFAIVPNFAAIGAAKSSASSGALLGVMGNQSLNVGLIGAGRQGRAILGELAKIDGVRVVAVCDDNESRLRAGARRVQGAEAFGDYREMLEKQTEMRAVIVATPTHLHRRIVEDSLSAGRHVYCEAPLAHTVDDTRAIARAARNAGGGLVFASGLEARSNPIYQLARTFYRTDAVRDPVSIEAQHFRKTSWRFPSPNPADERAINWRLDPEVTLGLPGELGVHQFDVAMWYTDRMPTAVGGGGAVMFHDDGRTVADTTHNTIRFDRGLAMQYQASLANSFQGRHEILRGSNATIKLAWTHAWMFKEADAPTQGWEVYANRQQFHNEEGITLIADATQLASQGRLQDGVGLPNPPLYYSLSDFVSSVRENKPAVCNELDGMRATIVAIHAAKAAETGTEQSIDAAMYDL